MRLILCCLVALAACGDAGPGNGDDAAPGDAGASVDSSPGSNDAAAPSGLTVRWTAQPGVPGTFASGVVISSVKLKITRLEVIGDSGTPPATTNLDIQWFTGTFPFPYSFDFAQQGLYSKVTLAIDGGGLASSFEILGSAMISGSSEQFKISDNTQLAVDINGYNVMLFSGLGEDIPIRVDMQPVLDAINFAALPIVANKRTMDQTTPGIQAVRDAMRTMTFLRGP